MGSSTQSGRIRRIRCPPPRWIDRSYESQGLWHTRVRNPRSSLLGLREWQRNAGWLRRSRMRCWWQALCGLSQPHARRTFASRYASVRRRDPAHATATGYGWSSSDVCLPLLYDSRPQRLFARQSADDWLLNQLLKLGTQTPREPLNQGLFFLVEFSTKPQELHLVMAFCRINLQATLT